MIMETFKVFFMAVISLALFISCDNSIDESMFDQNKGNLGAKANGTRSIPFKADFFTIKTEPDVGSEVVSCTEDPYLSLNYQVGEGNGTHLGKFDVTMSFCGAGFDYKNGRGVFVAANGDELYFNVPSEGEVGHVILDFENLPPPYEANFQDPFSFDGGTGRFVGATGGGMTNSFVDLFDDGGIFILEHRTDHDWTGTLILPLNNKKK